MFLRAKYSTFLLTNFKVRPKKSTFFPSIRTHTLWGNLSEIDTPWKFWGQQGGDLSGYGINRITRRVVKYSSIDKTSKVWLARYTKISAKLYGEQKQIYPRGYDRFISFYRRGSLKCPSKKKKKTEKEGEKNTTALILSSTGKRKTNFIRVRTVFFLRSLFVSYFLFFLHGEKS